MTEQPSSKRSLLYRQAGNLLFFGLQAVIVLGIVLFIVSSRDEKPSPPRSHEANFGDEVVVAGNSVGCPTEEVLEKWLNTTLEKGDEAALEVAVRGLPIGRRLDRRHRQNKRPSAPRACVRRKDKPYCLRTIDSRLNVTEPSGEQLMFGRPLGSLPRPRVISGSAQRRP
jgi:hypothetical protein